MSTVDSAADAPPSAGARSRVVVRALAESDHEAVAELTVASYVGGGHIPAGDAYEAVLRDVAGRAARAEVLVAELDGEVVGSVVLTPHGTAMSETARPDEYEFRMLAVHPRAHRRGVARALLRAVLDRARAAEGVRAVALTTMPSMRHAHRMYEALGFERVPERDWWLRDVLPEVEPAEDPGPFLVYRLTLDPADVTVSGRTVDSPESRPIPSQGAELAEITRDQVAHLASLAHIRMSETELETLSGELGLILDSVSAVQKVAGADVEPTSHPIALHNVFREDVPAGMLTQEQALDQAPDAEDGQFKVPAILDGE